MKRLLLVTLLAGAACSSDVTAPLATTTRLVIAGNSIGTSDFSGDDPWTGITLGAPYEVANHSEGGARLREFVAAYVHEPAIGEYIFRARNAALVADFTPSNCWLILQSGLHDTIDRGAGPAYDAATALIQQAHRMGVRVVVSTILPASLFPNPSEQAAWDAVRRDYNARVRTNAAGADAIADVAGDPVMGTTASLTNPALYLDGVHPTAAGNVYLKHVYATALAHQISAAQ